MKDSFNDLMFNELVTKRDEMTRQYRDLCFNMVIGHVDNQVQKRVFRRKIARLNTLIHEFDLGIRKQK
jgi:large subunit ribosomal protein L29